MPATIAAARAGATTGEWAQALRDVFGSYRAPTGVGEAAAGPPSESSEELREEVERVSEALGRRLKILVGKPGLDGHSNGAEQIAVRARDAGMDVVYEGIRLTPSQIAASALQEGVHVVGLSILSGSHRELIPAVIDALREARRRRRRSSSAGSSPRPTSRRLKEAGVAAVYTPKDFDLTQIMRDIVALVAERHGAAAAASHGRLTAAAATDRAPSSARGCASGDLTAAPAALNLVENRAPARRDEIAALLREVSPAALGGEAPGHVVGVTGPPGAGKSSLLSELVAAWRAGGRTVAVLAVDPSSQALGRRAARRPRAHRPSTRPTRASSSARRRPASSSAASRPATRAAAQALAAAFDVVVIETVGVGQSETDVADVADTVAVVVQPGSGDVLQFLKAGIMEIPDVLVVTKADLGHIAMRARRDLHAALRSLGARDTAVVAVSSIPPPSRASTSSSPRSTPTASALDVGARRLAARRHHALADFAAEHGERGLRALGGRRAALKWLAEQDAGLDVPGLVQALEARGDRPGVTPPPPPPTPPPPGRISPGVRGGRRSWPRARGGGTGGGPMGFGEAGVGVPLGRGGRAPGWRTCGGRNRKGRGGETRAAGKTGPGQWGQGIRRRGGRGGVGGGRASPSTSESSCNDSVPGSGATAGATAGARRAPRAEGDRPRNARNAISSIAPAAIASGATTSAR